MPAPLTRCVSTYTPHVSCSIMIDSLPLQTVTACNMKRLELWLCPKACNSSHNSERQQHLLHVVLVKYPMRLWLPCGLRSCAEPITVTVTVNVQGVQGPWPQQGGATGSIRLNPEIKHGANAGGCAHMASCNNLLRAVQGWCFLAHFWVHNPQTTSNPDFMALFTLRWLAAADRM